MGRTARNYPKGKLKLRTPKELQPGKRYPVYIEYNWQADSMRKTTEVTVFSKDWNEKGYGGIGEIRAEHLERKDFILANQRKQCTELDNEIAEKRERLDTENGNAIKSGVANLFGKGKYAEMEKENKRLKEELPKQKAAL